MSKRFTFVLLASLLAFAAGLALSTWYTHSQEAVSIYLLSPQERNSILFEQNQQKNYQYVVDTTQEGIISYKDSIWEDVDFWNHRGVALYSLGACAEAGASFYHVLVLEPNDPVALKFMSELENRLCKEINSPE